MQKSKPNRAIRNKSENSQLKVFLQIQLFAIVVYLIFFLTGSFIALAADVSGKYDYIISLVLFTASSFVVGYYTGIKLRRNGLLMGILYSLPINILVLIISLILDDFIFSFNILISLAVLIAFAGIGGVLAVNKRLRR